MKQQHHPWDNKTVQRGANTDIEPEHVARMDGTYVDAQNMRLSSQNGADGALSKISGEVIKWTINEVGAGGYECIGRERVKSTIVAFWAHPDANTYPPIVTIDGVVMVQSFLLPYTTSTFLQLAHTEDCEYGMVFDARSNGIPLFFDIEAIVDAYNNGEDTYFEGLDITQLQVNLATPVDRPRYYGLVDLGTGGGLPPGNYYYAIRYANQDGDVTSIGPETGSVYIPAFTMGAPAFPSAGIEGSGQADVGIKTRYGARVKFRVNNVAHFERAQLIRVQYNEYLGQDSVPKIIIAKEFNILPGEISVIEYVDNGDGEEVVPPDEAQEQRFFIAKANSVRYINYRVVYGGIELASRDVALTFTDVGGVKMFPITKNIGTKGHADPVNNCYYRSFMRGDKKGFGVQMYDPAGGLTFVTPIPDYDDYQFPNRRDRKDGDSLLYSGLDSYCWAANTDTQAADRVTPTFEVFDHDNASGKDEIDRFVNIMEASRRFMTPFYPNNAWTSPTSEDGIFVDGQVVSTAYTKPLRPVAPTDADKFGLQYRVNDMVRNAPPLGVEFPYNPKVFDVNYHALGMMMYGISGFPDWVQGFSIVGTPDAGRVAFQGLGVYSLVDPDTQQDPQNRAKKELGKVSVIIPDWIMGSVNQEVIEDVINNPQNNAIQMVSPLGICSEVYGNAFFSEYVAGSGIPKAIITDMISYARVMWDTGQINPGNNVGGQSPTIPGPIGDHYTDFGNWRNGTNIGPWHIPGQGGGNAILQVLSAEIRTENGARWLDISFVNPIYNTADPGTSVFSAAGAFHEPWYVLNIVKTGIVSDETLGYKTLNHYQKIRSVVGVYDGISGQELPLIDERPEDVLPGLSGQPCYVWVGGERLLCENGLAPATITALAAAIALNGSTTDPFGNTIVGLYQCVQSGDETLIRLTANSFLSAGDQVEVRYNSSIPFSFFGDTTTVPSIGATINKQAVAVAEEYPGNGWIEVNGGSPQAAWRVTCGGSSDVLPVLNGCPLPFAGYGYNSKYYVPFGRPYIPPTPPNVAGAYINQDKYAVLSTVRQWVSVFDCECRSPGFLLEQSTTNKVFPKAHYVQRPYLFNPDASLADNAIFPQYETIYPDENTSTWRLGGFKFMNYALNPDYAVQRPRQFVKKPEFGFVEETDLCSAIVWSARAAPNIQNSPGLRTFPAGNIYYIQNDTGDINRLFSSPSGAGFNLYAITDRGVVMVLVNKSVAYSADGSSFTLLKNDAFILDNSEVWISRNQGMPDPWYQTAAEGAAFVGQGAVRQEVLFWYNGETVLVLAGQSVIDIAKGRYRKAIADHIGGGRLRNLSGVFDQLNDEYWCVVNGKPFVYAASPGLQGWAGAYTYDFDQYLHVDGITYGLRDGQHWVLDQGYQISGEPLTAWVKGASAMMPTTRMEWVRYKTISSNKPDRVEFYDDTNTLVAWLDPSEPAQGPLYLKLEDGWEQYIPRKNASIDPTRKRIQGRLIFHKTMHSSESPFRVILLCIQTKPIK